MIRRATIGFLEHLLPRGGQRTGQATAGGQRFYAHQQARKPGDDHGLPLFDCHASVAAQPCSMQQTSHHLDDHAQMFDDRQEASTTRNICSAKRAVPSDADDDTPASGWQTAAATFNCSAAQHGQPLLAEEALFAETTAAMAKLASPSLQQLHTSNAYDAVAHCQQYSQLHTSEALQNFASVPLRSLQPHDPAQLPSEEHTKAPTQRCGSVPEARRPPDDNSQSSQACTRFDDGAQGDVSPKKQTQPQSQMSEEEAATRIQARSRGVSARRSRTREEVEGARFVVRWWLESAASIVNDHLHVVSRRGLGGGCVMHATQAQQHAATLKTQASADELTKQRRLPTPQRSDPHVHHCLEGGVD